MAGLPDPTRLFLSGIFSFLLYGIYIMVFGTCIHVLGQKAHGKNKVHFISTILLFSLSSLALAFSAAQICVQLPLYQLPGEVPALNEKDLSNLIYKSFVFNTGIEVAQLLSTLVAEAILIYRCYVLWNNKIAVIVVPIILSIAETGLLLFDLILVSIEDFPTKPPSPDQTPIRLLIAFVSVCAATNLSLSCLIGSRILYLSHSSRSVFGDQLDKRYKKIVTVILESGILYSAFLVTYLVLVISEAGTRLGAQALQPSVIQITGLAPTLIVVRSGLRIGKDSESSAFGSSRKNMPFQSDVSKESSVALKVPNHGLKQLHDEQSSGSVESKYLSDKSLV
ncbi:hypothetical protein K435DRAFT_966351 [Dendrothele bispora CBS 962.96]|uniref:Uncharacterized protein n=1 Tax=Dendrothele bispora (strain CBS 962.96) TaxID=1314807 RepID=A0A4S8M1P0_DENBC|nr:hypothetical protein K435DRAFT_966351 [Dendrothele bispora CBS 962.96]